MIHFENAEELQRLTANCIAKGLVVRHPDELAATADANLIRHLAELIEEIHEGVRAEIAVTLVPSTSRVAQIKYLSELRAMFFNDVLTPAVKAAAALRSTMMAGLEVNSARIPAHDVVQAAAVFRIQTICLVARNASEFSMELRKELGQYYLIATRADVLVRDILREVVRQERYLATGAEIRADAPAQVANTRQAPTAPKHLFSSKFTLEQCDKAFEAALIIHDKEQGYGLRQGVRPATFYGAVEALIKNRLLVGDIKHTVRQLSDFYGVNINTKTQFKETTPKGRKNLALSKGRKQIELKLVEAKLLQIANAYYLNKQ